MPQAQTDTSQTQTDMPQAQTDTSQAQIDMPQTQTDMPQTISTHLLSSPFL